MKKFAERFKELRKEHNFSQGEVAIRLCVSSSVVCYWETNRTEPTAPNIVKIAELFGVSSDYLLGLKDD